MRRYALSEDAERDLDELVAFISADSVAAAQRVLAELDAAMAHLAEDDVRFWAVHSYLIVYRAEVDPIQILRIVSGYRDLVELLR